MKRFFSGRPPVRRLVFWTAIALMLIAAVVGLIEWFPERQFGRVSVAALSLGIGALVVAIVFGLLQQASRTFHPESELFRYADVDTLRGIARRTDDPELRDWALSLADRITVVLPGREAPPPSASVPRPRVDLR